MIAERLNNRENDFARRGLNRVSLEVVKLTIDIGLLVGVQAVEVHHLQQRLAIDLASGDISKLITCSITQVLDIELKVVFLNLVSAKGIHILHRQVPHGEIGR